MYKESIKPVLDYVVAAVMIIIASVPLLIIFLTLKFTSKDTAIYKQQRIGQHGKEFEIYKFRSMHADTPIIVGDERKVIRNKVTKVGRFLRDTSLDELPQLFNIIKGDMSIVGPRPVVSQEASVIENRRKLGVLELKPGITGLAQVNGRKRLGNRKKVELDAQYAREVSFTVDLRIIGRTLPIILVRDNIQKKFR